VIEGKNRAKRKGILDLNPPGEHKKDSLCGFHQWERQWFNPWLVQCPILCKTLNSINLSICEMLPNGKQQPGDLLPSHNLQPGFVTLYVLAMMANVLFSLRLGCWLGSFVCLFVCRINQKVAHGFV